MPAAVNLRTRHRLSGGHPRYGMVGAPVSGYAARYVPDGPYQDAGRTTPITANGAQLGSWDDASGNGHHLLQATGTKQPFLKTGAGGINGYTVVSTDGADDFLKTAPFTLSQPWTIYIVCRPLRVQQFQSIADGNTDLSGWLGDFSLGPWNVSLAGGGYLSSRAGNYVDGQNYWPNYNWSPGGLAPVPVLFSACFNGAASWVSVNDQVRFGVNPGALNAGGFTLGCRGDNVTFPGKFDYAEAILYPFAVTAPQHQQNRAYCNQKYNLYPRGISPDAPLFVVHSNSLGYGSGASIPGILPNSTSWPAKLIRIIGLPLRALNVSQPGQTSTVLAASETWQVRPLYDPAARKRIAFFHEGPNEFAHIGPDPQLAYNKLASWVAGAHADGYLAGVGTAMRSTNGTLGTAYWNPAAPTAGFQYLYNQKVYANTAGADFIIDFASVPELQDPNDSRYFDPTDHLHCTDLGYDAMAREAKTDLLPLMY